MFLVRGFFWKVVSGFKVKVEFDGFLENKPEERDNHIVIDGIPMPKEQITLLTEVKISGVKPLDLCKVMGVAVRTPVKEAVKGTIYDSEFRTVRDRINAIITVERNGRRVIDRESVMKNVDEIIEFGRAVIISELRDGNFNQAKMTANDVMDKLQAVIVEVYDAPTKAQALQGYKSYSEALLGRAVAV